MIDHQIMIKTVQKNKADVRNDKVRFMFIR